MSNLPSLLQTSRNTFLFRKFSVQYGWDWITQIFYSNKLLRHAAALSNLKDDAKRQYDFDGSICIWPSFVVLLQSTLSEEILQWVCSVESISCAGSDLHTSCQKTGIAKKMRTCSPYLKPWSRSSLNADILGILFHNRPMTDAFLRIAYMSSWAEVQTIHEKFNPQSRDSILMTKSPSMWVPDVNSSEGRLVSIEELLDAKELCRTSANLPTSCIHQHIMSKHPKLCNSKDDGFSRADLLWCNDHRLSH